MTSRALRFLLAALLALPGCRTPQANGGGKDGVADERQTTRDPDGPIALTLVATNDLHGWVHPNTHRAGDGTEVPEGGVVALSGYLSILRAANPGGVVLLDGGDLFQGTLASNLTEGEVVVAAMNHLGYAAAALGNHEFDYGPLGPVSVASDPGVDAFGALKARLKQAKFPLLAVNIYDARTGVRPEWLTNDGTAILEVKGLKIGVVGFITPSTPFTTNPVNVSTLRFGSLVPEAADAVARLRARGVDLVIGVAHAGGKCGTHDDRDDLSTCDTKDGEIFELLQGIPEGMFDAMIAGHTHSELAKVVNGTPLVETRGLGRAFATIELFVDPKTRRVLKDRTVVGRNVPICAVVDASSNTCDSRAVRKLPAVKLVPATFMGKTVKPDEKLEALLAPAMARAENEQKRKLGLSVPQALTRDYHGESALGDFLSDSLRQMESADVVLFNSGGLRADLPAGELSYGDVYEVLPFDNTIATLTLTGDELKRLLNAAYGGQFGVFQVSGLRVTLNRCPGKGRLRSFTFSDGRPAVPDKRYRVVLPDFLARGGDGLGPVVSSLGPSRIDYGMARELNLRDGLVAWWQKKGQPLVAPQPGRIAFAGSGAACSSGQTVSQH